MAPACKQILNIKKGYKQQKAYYQGSKAVLYDVKDFWIEGPATDAFDKRQ